MFGFPYLDKHNLHFILFLPENKQGKELGIYIYIFKTEFFVSFILVGVGRAWTIKCVCERAKNRKMVKNSKNDIKDRKIA